MIKSIQTLRLVFCLLVFICHYARHFGLPLFEYGGDGGVEFFFILSGFVLSIGFGTKIDGGEFYYKQFLYGRILKIYPAHIVALTMSLALGLYAGIAHFSILKTLIDIAMLQSWSLSSDIIFYGNGPSWFISTLLFCYALFPFLYRNITTKGKVWFSILAIAYYAAYFCIVPRFDNHTIDTILYAFPPMRLADFAIGIWLYKLYRSPLSEKIKSKLMKGGCLFCTLLDLLVISVCMSTYWIYVDSPSWFRFSMLFWLPFSLLIYYFSLSDNGCGAGSRLLRVPFLRTLGGLSFEFYIIHVVAVDLVTFAYGRLIGYDNIVHPVLFTMCLCGSFVAAYLLKVSCKSMTNNFIPLKWEQQNRG